MSNFRNFTQYINSSFQMVTRPSLPVLSSMCLMPTRYRALFYTKYVPP